ncbi:restriction endonuclease [Niabella pedocola]|uniref:Restriction endonuclease n=1 Tax=Niabella pedocola TaxID=1752077 RepID=A0ABS8PXB2_9BACT|nr:restriction endonuclease [Niabella pedocola]MCD2424937.1 restriction endonuclease [Niabella pedocola]
MSSNPNLYCVRADFGTYTKHFLKGGYVAIGWLSGHNLSEIKDRESLYPIYRNDYPEDESNVVVGQQVGQIARFLLEIKAGDYVITPDSNTEYIHYGVIENDPSYFYGNGEDGCPFLHRRRIRWNKTPVQRSIFSVPFQNTIRSSLTVFSIVHKQNFFEAIGKKEFVAEGLQHQEYDYYNTVLNRILELDDKEFEILITHLLTAVGFEGAEHTGKVGDGGVDATGELDVSNMAKIKLFVQAKRYKLGSRINANTVKALRQNIPSNGQGAFITTCDYSKDAKDIAVETGFPRIGLINGNQLVDLLVKYWDQIPNEFKEKLNLKLGLVIS